MKKWMSLSLLALLVSGAMMTTVSSAYADDHHDRWRNDHGRIERLRAEAFRKRQIASNNYWRNNRFDNRYAYRNNWNNNGWHNGWFNNNNNNRWDRHRWDNRHRWVNAPGRW